MTCTGDFYDFARNPEYQRKKSLPFSNQPASIPKHFKPANMKSIAFFLSMLLSTCALFSQSNDYKVVFDLTSKDTIDQRSVIRWINEITGPHPDAKIEVVTFGLGTALLVKDRSYVPDAVAKCVANKNVSFKICAIAMKNQHLEPTDLLPGVQIVPDGIYEIISKQREGWGYIKASH
jgi:intracellular sulfur oxidation DsrE/DsrF family protein